MKLFKYIFLYSFECLYVSDSPIIIYKLVPNLGFKPSNNSVLDLQSGCPRKVCPWPRHQVFCVRCLERCVLDSTSDQQKYKRTVFYKLLMPFAFTFSDYRFHTMPFKVSFRMTWLLGYHNFLFFK